MDFRLTEEQVALRDVQVTATSGQPFVFTRVRDLKVDGIRQPASP